MPCRAQAGNSWAASPKYSMRCRLIDSGVWQGAGVLGPEAFPADPFLELLGEYGHPHGIEDRT